MNLLPHPRFLKRRPGFFHLPRQSVLQLDGTLSAESARAIHERLQAAARAAGVSLIRGRKAGARTKSAAIAAIGKLPAAPAAEAHSISIKHAGIRIEFAQVAGLHAAVATLRQLLREYGRRLPCLEIRDHPDFPRRGVMLDISRGRVPRVETLLEFVDHLADFKINEFQLYVEHTFAYRNYRPVWRAWGALTGAEIRRLAARCRALGIDLVPNQNSFGHLRWWLEHPPLKQLAEVAEPWPDEGGAFLRYPSTLAPNHPGTLPFLRSLYDELLPNFSGDRFNVGCDETWDLGRGQSRELCRKLGKGRVYLNFLRQIHRAVKRRGRRMMFWGDIIVHHPGLVRELPREAIALNWGYEAGHPFDGEAAVFAKSGIPFYVCPGTSTWMTLIGRHDNALANLREAARAGRRHGAAGMLIADWGDGGHPQPLAVSYLPLLFGAAEAWCGATNDESKLTRVLSRDIFQDATGHAARAALALGLAHRQLKFRAPNLTPLGAVIAAPRPEARELFCREGLKYFAQIPRANVRSALRAIEKARAELARAKPATTGARLLVLELELAARMAAQSCRHILWQQLVAAGRPAAARKLARGNAAELRRLDRDFRRYWPRRNKATPAKCSAFLQWRIHDYRRAKSPFSAGSTKRPSYNPPACEKS